MVTLRSHTKSTLEANRNENNNSNNHNHQEDSSSETANNNNHNNQVHHSHGHNVSSLPQHHTGIAGRTQSQTGNAGTLQDTPNDVGQENSTSVRSMMDDIDLAPLESLPSQTSSKKKKLSSSSPSTSSKSSSQKRLWYCDGSCNSGNGLAQSFNNFQSFQDHIKNRHNLKDSPSKDIASAINNCRHNQLNGNPQVYGCPHAGCQTVFIGSGGLHAHWGLMHPDVKKPDVKKASPSFNTDLYPDSSSTMSEITSTSHSGSRHGTTSTSNIPPPTYTNGIDSLLEGMNENANEDDMEEEDPEEEEEDAEAKQETEEIYGFNNATSSSPPHHRDDEHFEVSDGERDDDDNQPVPPINQVAEGMIVEPSTRPKIDYFAEINEEGAIVFPTLKVDVLKGQAHRVIADFLALPEAEQLEHICGVRHLRTNDVHSRHKAVYRDITKRLMRAILGSYLDSYITNLRPTEVETNSEPPTDMEVDNPGMENESCNFLTVDERAITATVAFHLLPTIYRMLKTSQRSLHGKTGSFLNGLLAIRHIDQLIGSIIFLFNKGRPKLGTNHTNNLAPPSDTTIMRKTRKLVLEDCHVSRGMNYLCRHAEKDNTDTPPPQLSPEEFHDKVATLHPKRHPLHDDLNLVKNCPPDPNLDTLKLKATSLNTTIRRLKRDGAPGFDGWTFQLIRQLFEEDMRSVNDDEPSEDALLLIAFIQHALAGRMPFSSLWNTSRMVLVSEWQPQKEAWKFRPIAIGTSWYRFIGKAALTMLGDSVGRQLAPCQLAVGIPDGISIGALLLQHVRNDPENAILSLDISNAFNSLRRNRILEGLHQYAPSLVPFYKWSYATPTQIRSSTGALCCNAETGTRQGDPLSMLFFSVGIHQRILELSARIQTLNSENLIQAYADDMSLCIPRRQLEQTWNVVADVFPIGLPGNITHDPHQLFDEIGIAINPLKCVAITGSPTLPVQPPLALVADGTSQSRQDIPPLEETILQTQQDDVTIPIRMSAKIFGVMIGTPEDRLNFVHDLHEQIRKKAGYIKSFCGAKAGFLLIKYCLNTIATYVHRIEYPLGLDLAGHDKIISDAIAFYVHQRHLGSTQDTIRALPHSLGGLGILHHDSFHTKINHDELHIRTLSWLEHKGPSPVHVEGAPGHDIAHLTANAHPGLHKLQQTFPPLNNDHSYLQTIGFPTGKRETLSASTRKLNAHKETVTKLKKVLVSHYNTLGDALWLDGSGFNGSGEVYNIGTFYTRFFTDRTFAAALSARLLINDTLPQDSSTHVRVYCPHCNMMDLPFPPTAMKYHYLACRALQRSRIGRHDQIVNNFHKFLSSVFNNHNNANIQCEQYTHQPDIDQRRDDITLTIHTGEVSMKMGFDIGVTTPVQSTLLERSVKSNQAVDSLGAATKMFDEKTHKYRNSHYDVYPIIFLATGRPLLNNMTKMLTAIEPHISVSKAELNNHWRRFLRNTMCTCTQFVAKAYLNRPALTPDLYRNRKVIAHQRKLNQTRLRLQRKRKFTDVRNTVLLTPRPTHNPTSPPSHSHCVADDASVIHLTSNPLADDDNSWTSHNPFNHTKDRNQFQ